MLETHHMCQHVPALGQRSRQHNCAFSRARPLLGAPPCKPLLLLATMQPLPAELPAAAALRPGAPRRLKWRPLRPWAAQ